MLRGFVMAAEHTEVRAADLVVWCQFGGSCHCPLKARTDLSELQFEAEVHKRKVTKRGSCQLI